MSPQGLTQSSGHPKDLGGFSRLLGAQLGAGVGLLAGALPQRTTEGWGSEHQLWPNT